jgi:hypothetical protein
MQFIFKKKKQYKYENQQYNVLGLSWGMSNSSRPSFSDLTGNVNSKLKF